jgi:hypothetical protein
MGPVERQGSLADLLFEILDDGDTDDLLLADLNKASKAAEAAGQQLQGQLGGSQQLHPQQAQAPQLQQLKQRKLLERLQVSKQQQHQQLQQGGFDIFALRDPSNELSSSLTPSTGQGTGTATTPWPSFSSAPGQPGPGAAALFGGLGGADPAAGSTADAGAALLQQLQLRVQGLPSTLPALRAAAGIAEGALLERQAMKQQLLQQQESRQQYQAAAAAADTSMTATGDSQQQQAAGAVGQEKASQQAPQQVLAMQAGQTPAANPADGAVGAAATAAGTADGGLTGTDAGGTGAQNSSAATAAALLAEAGDDLNLDLDFLESMLQVRCLAVGACTAMRWLSSVLAQFLSLLGPALLAHADCTASAGFTCCILPPLAASAGLQLHGQVAASMLALESCIEEAFALPACYVLCLQDTNGGEFKMLGDLARMVSLPVSGMQGTGDAPGTADLTTYQQQQQLRALQQSGAPAAAAGPASLTGDVGQTGRMQPPAPQQQQQQLGGCGSVAGVSQAMASPAVAQAGVITTQQEATAFAKQPPAAGKGSMQPSMDSGMRSAVKNLSRLQIPSTSGDLGLSSLQNPMSVDATRPGMDQSSLVGAQGRLTESAQNRMRQLQHQGLGGGFGALGMSGAKPPLPASSSRSGVGPSNSAPDESDGSVDLGAAEPLSDGEVEQSASGRRTSARRRSRLALAKQKRQQQKAAAAAAAAGRAKSEVRVQQTPNTSQPQMVPGGMLSLLLNGGSCGTSMGLAAASCQMQQLDVQQQQQMMLQSYGSAPNPGMEGPQSPAMLATAASTGHMGLVSPPGSTMSADPIQALPRKQLTAVLATLAPNALQQLLILQQRQPALARVVLKRALQQLQQQNELGVQHQGLEGLLGGLAPADASGGPLQSLTPSAAAAAGFPSVFKLRQSSSKGGDVPSSRGGRNKAPLVFYRQRGSKAMTNMGGKQGIQQTQRAGSAPLADTKQEMLSQAGAGMAMDSAQLQQLDPAMAAALCVPSGAAAAGIVSGDGGGQARSGTSSDMASSEGAPPAQQQPSSGSRRAGLGKRIRQITQNDLSGTVAAAIGNGGGSNPMDGPPGTISTPQSSGALPFLPMQQGQLQLQDGLSDAMQLGTDGPGSGLATRGDQGSMGGLAVLIGQNASVGTGSTASAGGAADAAVITQQARALVRILTKLNTPQLIQTRTMLHSVLQRSAPGLLDHMGAIERMINQLINLKQQQPLLPQQQQQQLLLQGAFGAGGSMFAAGGGAVNMGFGLDDNIMGQQQQQQNQLQAATMLQQQQQQQQHMLSWPSDPFVQQQQQGQVPGQQGQVLQAQLQNQLQSPWCIATSLSVPQPVQWNAQQCTMLQQPDAAAPAVGAGATGSGAAGAVPEDDTDQTPYQLATRRQQGRRCKAKPDKRQQKAAAAAAAAAAAGVRMAASAPASIPQPAAAAAGNTSAVSMGMISGQQQQQQLGIMGDLPHQQQQRLQQLQQQQLQMQQQLQVQQGLGMGASQAMQQQQAGLHMQRDPLAPAAAGGEGIVLDAAQERQQEDMLLSWLQNDGLEDWPEGQDMLGVLSG